MDGIPVVSVKAESSLAYPELMTKFMRDGVVESNSPKLRKKLYTHLRQERINFTTEIVAYLPTTKEMKYYYDGGLGRVTRWIVARRILADDLRKVCERYYNHIEADGTRIYVFDDIKAAFEPGLSGRQVYSIIDRAWGRWLKSEKYGPFCHCPIYKTVVRISKLSKLP
jgi:hypothetical protein